MNTYITRVELHGASSQDYILLHQYMAQSKFSRDIVSGDGKKYRLPEAEYVSYANDINIVVSLAKTAANATGRNSIVFTSQAATWKADGMVLVK